MSFNISAVSNLDGAAETNVTAGGFDYPIIMWTYGDPKQKKAGGMDYLGGFFAPIPEPRAEDDDESKAKIAEVAAKMAELLPAAGWVEETMIHADNTSTPGYYKRDAVISVIAMRKKWEVVEGETRQSWAWNWDNFEAAKAVGTPKTRMHILIAVKGTEGVGPFLLTLKGISQMYFEGTNKTPGVLSQFFRAVIVPANTLTKSQTPYRVFWMPVGAGRLEDNTPDFQKMGKGTDVSYLVMPSLLGVPAKGDKALLDKLYVGDGILPMLNQMYDEAKEWAAAWDTITPGNNGGNESNGATPEPVKADPVGSVDLASLGL